jgi:hypothetical protein
MCFKGIAVYITTTSVPVSNQAGILDRFIKRSNAQSALAKSGFSVGNAGPLYFPMMSLAPPL